MVSGAARYRLLGDSLRSLARREPTMALHVHVGVPQPEDAIRLLNGLRRSVPVLLALSANSPFWQGRDGGFHSMRTVIFQAFPRTGPPRSFAGYADYVDALDAVIGAGAVPDPNFFWWDVRPQPKLGTVEVRVMDAQSTLADVTPLVALIQSLSRLELEGDPPQPAPNAEVLAENRFLAARDGMAARLIEPATGGWFRYERRSTRCSTGAARTPWHWVARASSNRSGCSPPPTAPTVSARCAATNGGLDHLVADLADLFLARTGPRPRTPHHRRHDQPHDRKGRLMCRWLAYSGSPILLKRSALHPGSLPG